MSNQDPIRRAELRTGLFPIVGEFRRSLKMAKTSPLELTRKRHKKKAWDAYTRRMLPNARQQAQIVIKEFKPVWEQIVEEYKG